MREWERGTHRRIIVWIALYAQVLCQKCVLQRAARFSAHAIEIDHQFISIWPPLIRHCRKIKETQQQSIHKNIYSPEVLHFFSVCLFAFVRIVAVFFHSPYFWVFQYIYFSLSTSSKRNCINLTLASLNNHYLFYWISSQKHTQKKTNNNNDDKTFTMIVCLCASSKSNNNKNEAELFVEKNPNEKETQPKYAHFFGVFFFLLRIM